MNGNALVRDEVEENLLVRLSRIGSEEASRVLDDYARLIALMKPEVVPYPRLADVKASRHLIRHEADVPVLLSAVASRPDWFLTHNSKHFTPTVARRTGLLFATPVEFFRALAKSISV
jgi:hypothetical protein